MASPSKHIKALIAPAALSLVFNSSLSTVSAENILYPGGARVLDVRIAPVAASFDKHPRQTPVVKKGSLLDFTGFVRGERKNLIWEDDFEAGGWRAKNNSGSRAGTVAGAPEWAQSMNQSDYSAKAVTSPVRAGKYAMRFEWQAKNYKKGSNVSKKASLFTAKEPTCREEVWWGFSMYCPADGMQKDSKAEILVQWHSTPDKGEAWTNPPLTLSNKNDELSVSWIYDTRALTPDGWRDWDRKRTSLGPTPKDRWVDFVWHVKWDPWGKGLLEIWMDGKKVVNQHDISLGFNDQVGNYMGIGLYKYEGTSDHAARVVYFDAVRGGNEKATYADVAPGGTAGKEQRGKDTRSPGTENGMAVGLSNSGNAEENIVYPTGAGVLDVTKAPYNAKGDGKTDDTQALIHCLDDARTQKNICYLPNGAYLVSDTLTYRRSVKDPKYKVEANQYVRIQGQSRNGVVIKLRDNLAFAGPVLSTIKEGNSNIAFAIRVANLTVDTGAGNPAAIGIRFSASNGGTLRYVTIRSGDGSGSKGLDIVDQGGPTYLHHITVDGFDTGIFLPSSDMFFEYVELNNQNKVGVLVDGASASFRKLISNNAVPALVNLREGQVVLLDSELNGGSDAVSAIINPGGDANQAALLVRNVRTRGYATAINDQGSNVSGSDVTEYSSHGVQKLWDETPGRTLNLPVKETPDVAWSDDPSDWAFVDGYGAVGDGQADDTAAIQRAMDSGKASIFFPPGKKYKVTKTITIGGAVSRVLFNYAFFDNIPLKLDQSLFKVVDGTAPVVLLEEFQNDFEYYTVVEGDRVAALAMREFWIKGRPTKPVTGGEVFIENVPAGVMKRASSLTSSPSRTRRSGPETTRNTITIS